jgi:hypothetical protein
MVELSRNEKMNKTTFLLKKIESQRACAWVLRSLGMVDLTENEVLAHLLSGSFFALVPEDLPDHRIYDFESGGVTPKGEQFHQDGYTLVAVVSLEDKLVATLKTTINRSTCYIYDPLSQPHETTINEESSVVVNDHLLYVAKPWLLSDKKLSEIIGRYTLPWYFLMLCSNTADSELYDKKMIDLVLDSICIVVGIYDGESYLVWKVITTEINGRG